MSDSNINYPAIADLLTNLIDAARKLFFTFKKWFANRG